MQPETFRAAAQTFSAILLAGGQSTRMGQDKAALDYHGESLLRHQAYKLRRLGIEDLVIAGGGISLPGARTVQDRFPGRGPLGGLHAALECVQNPSALVLPVDTPLVPEALLLELLAAHQGGVTVAAAFDNIEPLIGVYDKALVPLCRELLESGRCSVRRLLDAAGFTTVEYRGEADLLANCNTPEEYARILSLRPTI